MRFSVPLFCAFWVSCLTGCGGGESTTRCTADVDCEPPALCLRGTCQEISCRSDLGCGDDVHITRFTEVTVSVRSRTDTEVAFEVVRQVG